jgi:hypothetical protein
MFSKGTFLFLLCRFCKILMCLQGQNISGDSAIKSMASPGGPSGRKPYMNTYFPGNPAGVGSQAQSINPLIGHKVLNRCPDDNKFYEAVISDYNHETVCFCRTPVTVSFDSGPWLFLRLFHCRANISWYDKNTSRAMGVD